MKVMALFPVDEFDVKQLALMIQQAVIDETDYDFELGSYDGLPLGKVVGLSDESDCVLVLSPRKVVICHEQDLDSVISGGPAEIHWPTPPIETWVKTFVHEWLG